jgi:hypothetical protein
VKKQPSKAICPLVRDIKPTVADRFIGRLTKLEFDLIDWLRANAILCDYATIADGMGWRVDNTRRYIRFMRSAGVLGYKVAERKADVEASHDAYMGIEGNDREFSYQRSTVYGLYGPTMKGLHMWHDALGEEWDWREYDGASWVTLEGVPTGAAAPASWIARTQRGMEEHQSHPPTARVS